MQTSARQQKQKKKIFRAYMYSYVWTGARHRPVKKWDSGGRQKAHCRFKVSTKTLPNNILGSELRVELKFISEFVRDVEVG